MMPKGSYCGYKTTNIKHGYTFDTFDSLTGSWSVWPHVVTPQCLLKKKKYFLPIYIITLVEKKIIID